MQSKSQLASIVSGLVVAPVLLAMVSLAGSVTPSKTDRYGGVAVQIDEPNPSFRVEKVGTRWVFVTPEGNPFWLLGVFNVGPTGSVDDLGDSYLNRIRRKYGDLYGWGEHTVKRLRSWGFNALAEYTGHYLLPTKSPYSDWSNPEKMAFVALMRPSYYGLMNKWSYAPAPFKDLIAGTDPTTYKGWRGNGLPDVFDPNFEAYIVGWSKASQPEVLKSPWLIGIATDDADNLVGFGPGPEVPAPRLHPHIGWLVLATNFEQKANPGLGVTYADPKVYSKYALRDFLKTKYGTLEALNAAWGSNYTSLDSDGGWPAGRGLLDENGRHSWVGRDYGKLADAAPAVRADLDEFLYQYARKYFSTVAGCVRQYAPKKLVFGPATLNGWGGLTRKEILRAAGEFVDVLQVGISSQQVLELTARYAGDKPIVTWEGWPANPDSALWRYSNPEGATPKTQQERAEKYAERVKFLFNAQTSAGVKPIVGLKWWAWVDSWGEKTNWGLVSFLDNAYDGKEAVRAPGKDSRGYPTGGEERDYGDFLSLVRQTNTAVLEELRQELESTGGHADSKTKRGTRR